MRSNPITRYWLEHYSSTGHCSICGNRGVFDTRGKVFTAAGFECGEVNFCICPNGQVMRKKCPDKLKEFTS